MNSDKAVSIGLLATASIYVLYAMSIEVRTIGSFRQVGPTAKTVPIILGLALFVLAASLALSAFRHAAEEEETSSAIDGFLVIAMLILSVAYTFLLRYVGFILTTSVLLYLLVFLARARLRQDISTLALAVGLLINTALMVGIFWVNRYLALSLAHYGREAGVAILSSRFSLSAIGLIVTGAIVVALNVVLRRIGGKALSAKFAVALLVSISTTQILDIVFRQVFQVSLPFGLLAF